MPGRRLTILYCPDPSVTTVRIRSMRAGLAASTVTPGITAPLVSLTVPAMVCACTAVAASTAPTATAVNRVKLLTSELLSTRMRSADGGRADRRDYRVWQKPDKQQRTGQ